MIALLVLAMIARVSADFLPRARTAHLIAAAICWLAGAFIWIARVIPKVTIAEAE